MGLFLDLYLVPGLSRITWVFYISVRRLFREYIIYNLRFTLIFFGVYNTRSYLSDSVGLCTFPIFARVGAYIFSTTYTSWRGEENTAL